MSQTDDNSDKTNHRYRHCIGLVEKSVLESRNILRLIFLSIFKPYNALDKIIRFLLESIEAAGCALPEPLFVCRECPDGMYGGFSPPQVTCELQEPRVCSYLLFVGFYIVII